MKKNILLVLAIILNFNCYNIFSQVIIDPPKLNQLDTLSILQREPDRFVRGWTCSAPGNMLDSAMYINTYHSYRYDLYTGTNNCVHNILIINSPGHYTSYLIGGRNENVAFNTQSLYLDPSLIVDTTQNFTPRANDNTGAAMGFDARLKIDPTKDCNVLENDNLQSIFGFINVKGRRDGDYQIFEKDSDYVNNGFVLSENWPSADLEHTLSNFIEKYNICN